MLKAWILSALGIGVIVAGVILATAEDSNGTTTPYVPTWRHLTEKEVVVCIRTLRKRDAILRANLEALVREGQKRSAMPEIHALARSHNLTYPQMKEIWDRVGKVVKVVRWQEEPSQARTKLEQQLLTEQDQAPTTEREKALHADKVARLEQLIKNVDMPHVDKLLVKKYWPDLSELVPR